MSVGSDTTSIASSSLTGTINDAYNLNTNVLAKNGIQAGRGNSLSKPILDSLKGIKAEICINLANITKPNLPNISQSLYQSKS